MICRNCKTEFEPKELVDGGAVKYARCPVCFYANTIIGDLPEPIDLAAEMREKELIQEAIRVNVPEAEEQYNPWYRILFWKLRLLFIKKVENDYVERDWWVYLKSLFTVKLKQLIQSIAGKYIIIGVVIIAVMVGLFIIVRMIR